MKIHAITQYSTVNGPGERMVIHFQGCRFQCPGCFNPETHSLSAGSEMTLEEILALLPSANDIDGVTISGGEPFLQQEALLSLTRAIRRLGLTIVVFSGFYRNEIEKLKNGPAILEQIDVLIDGRFDETAVSSFGLHGSNNQTIHLFTSAYTEADFQQRDVELTFTADGMVSVTGFPNQGLLSAIQ